MTSKSSTLTAPLFDDPWSRDEYLARVQMGLDDSWRLVSLSRSIPVGLDSRIEKLEADDELDDVQRWQSIDVGGLPVASLPPGMLLAIMKQGIGDESPRKAAFILTHSQQNS